MVTERPVGGPGLGDGRARSVESELVVEVEHTCHLVQHRCGCAGGDLPAGLLHRLREAKEAAQGGGVEEGQAGGI
jgi:hypothetical protein